MEPSVMETLEVSEVDKEEQVSARDYIE